MIANISVALSPLQPFIGGADDDLPEIDRLPCNPCDDRSSGYGVLHRAIPCSVIGRRALCTRRSSATTDTGHTMEVLLRREIARNICDSDSCRNSGTRLMIGDRGVVLVGAFTAVSPANADSDHLRSVAGDIHAPSMDCAAQDDQQDADPLTQAGVPALLPQPFEADVRGRKHIPRSSSRPHRHCGRRLPRCSKSVGHRIVRLMLSVPWGSGYPSAQCSINLGTLQ